MQERASFRGVGDGSWVLLRGNSTGWDVEGQATAYVEHRELHVSHGQPLPEDNLYCDIRVVFTPSMPDPDGHSLKFAGAGHCQDIASCVGPLRKIRRVSPGPGSRRSAAAVPVQPQPG